MVGDGGRQKASDKIAGDIAGNVGRKRPTSRHGAAFLAEIGQRQGEGRDHEHALGDAERCEGCEVGRRGEQRCRNRQQP